MDMLLYWLFEAERSCWNALVELNELLSSELDEIKMISEVGSISVIPVATSSPHSKQAVTSTGLSLKNIRSGQ